MDSTAATSEVWEARDSPDSKENGDHFHSLEESPVILLVDDEPKNLQVAATILRRSGFDIIFASNGPEALDAAAEEDPDIILLDIMMPGMDGHEVCERLKTEPDTANIPVIFLTASRDESDLVKGFNLGAVDYVVKPVRPRELLARVQTQTRLKQAESQLRRANEKLHEVNQNQNSFFKIISQDLQRPITGFRAFSGILEQDRDSLEIADILEFCRDFRDEADRTQRLLEHLQQWASLNLDKVPFAPRRLRLVHAAETAIDAQASGVRMTKVRIYNEIDPELYVEADPDMLTSIFSHLLTNALQHTPNGGQITLTAGHDPDEDHVEVSVIDTGSGIPAEQLPNLFRVEKIRDVAGKTIGLGLVLTRGFLRKHGGDIRILSKPGQGTRAIFTLPLTQEENSKSQIPNSKQ